MGKLIWGENSNHRLETTINKPLEIGTGVQKTERPTPMNQNKGAFAKTTLLQNRPFWGGIKRDKLNGKPVSLRFCGFLQFFCENLRLQCAVIPRKSENQQKSVKICKKLRIWLRLSLLVCPF